MAGREVRTPARWERYAICAMGVRKGMRGVRGRREGMRPWAVSRV